jgi:hypothetical protein
LLKALCGNACGGPVIDTNTAIIINNKKLFENEC